MEKVFTYELLKTEGDEALLNGYRKIYRLHASIVPDENGFVTGRVRTVDEDTLKEFDDFEGVAEGYYHRFRVNVLYPDGTQDETWVYQQVVDDHELADKYKELEADYEELLDEVS